MIVDPILAAAGKKNAERMSGAANDQPAQDQAGQPAAGPGSSRAFPVSAPDARVQIPTGTAGDAMLRAMPIDTKEQAQAFVEAHKDWLAANNPYGMGAMMPKNAKPATLRAPDIGEKVRKAYDIAEANYWQMPYKEAKVRFYGLPLA
jgi:hypothetical protein